VLEHSVRSGPTSLVVERGGFEGVRLHDCRHGVGTKLRKDGVPVEVVSKVLGHSSVAFTMATHVHPDAEMLDRARDALEAAFTFQPHAWVRALGRGRWRFIRGSASAAPLPTQVR